MIFSLQLRPIGNQSSNVIPLQEEKDHIGVGLRGFEPPTPGPPDQCANQTAPQPATTSRYRGYATDPQLLGTSTYLL